MDNQEMIDAIKQGVVAGVQEALKSPAQDPAQDFTYVPREEHYRHHEFLGEVIEWLRGGKKTVSQTIFRGLTLGIIALLGYGIYYLFKLKTGGA